MRSFLTTRPHPLLLGWLWGLAAVTGWAQSASAPVTLADYLTRALAENRDLAAFGQRYEAARARIPQAAALPDPMLQVSHFVESVQTRTGPQDNLYLISQRLPWFGRLSQRKSAAHAEAEALWFAWQNRQLQLTRAVASGYYNYALNAKSIELTAANLDLLRQLEPIVTERSRTGGNLNALLRLKVELGRLGDQLETLRQTRPQLSAQLAAQLALPPAEVLPTPSWDPVQSGAALPLPAPADLLAAVDSTNPELQMLARREVSATARRELARLESRPDLTVGLNYIDVGRSTMTPTPAGSGRDPWNVFVAVNLPIWPSRLAGARTEAQANLAAAIAEQDDRRNQLHAEAQVALTALSDAQRRLRLYRDELLPLARQAAENTRSSYATGGATLLDVIDSERTLLDLELAQSRAATDAARQRVVVLTLANQPL